MSKKARAILGVLIGIPATAGLFVFGGYKVAICILLVMWADNISRG